MNRLSKLVLAAGMALAAGSLAVAQERDHHASHTSSSTSEKNATASASAARSDRAMSEGVVTKVDRNANKLTIKHGELANLGMPPMTMVFGVKDSAMLDQLKAGDKINFVADKVGGRLTVTRLQMQQ